MISYDIDHMQSWFFHQVRSVCVVSALAICPWKSTLGRFWRTPHAQVFHFVSRKLVIHLISLKHIMNPWCEIQFSVQFHTLQQNWAVQSWHMTNPHPWMIQNSSRKVSCWPKSISGRTRLDRCCMVDTSQSMATRCEGVVHWCSTCQRMARRLMRLFSLSMLQ